MWRSEKRRMRDRVFIPFDWDRHWVRAFAMLKEHAPIWDLFPPPKGYRPYSQTKSYLVSPERQHRDWSKVVLDAAGRKCTNCGATGRLEAHHLWPQSWLPNLRYLPRNGVALCRACHQTAPWKPEITPNQFRWLTGETETINAHIEESNFWEYSTAALEKGRVLLAGIDPVEFDLSSPKVRKQLNYFLKLNGYNDFLGMFVKAATAEPHADPFFTPGLDRLVALAGLA